MASTKILTDIQTLHNDWCRANGYPVKWVKLQATSRKHQATSDKLQAASNKPQAPSSKHQASSRKRQAS
jgi:hypothetical protein